MEDLGGQSCLELRACVPLSDAVPLVGTADPCALCRRHFFSGSLRVTEGARSTLDDTAAVATELDGPDAEGPVQSVPSKSWRNPY